MRLRIGVIGLGRRWRRYRALLARLREHVEVRAVCDPIARRTEIEARRLSCAAADGSIELLERADVEAVLLLDPQWYGLWPLEHACRVNKPVLCALSPARDEGHADALRERIDGSGLPVFMALPSLLAPAMRHLRELLTHRLGAARLVRVGYSAPPLPLSPSVPGDNKGSGDLLDNPVVPALLAACAWLLDDAPRSVWTFKAEDASFVTLILRFGGERLAQVNLWTAAVGRVPPRFELVAETGTAMAELPRQLRWRDADGQHAQHLPPRSLEQSSLERFILALRAGQSPRPSFADVHQALTWQRAAVRSRSEGRSIALG